MTVLTKENRKLLENVTIAARLLSEKASRAALENLAVHEKEYRAHMTVAQRLLRNRLRARGRALGDEYDTHSGRQALDHLVDLAAYEHWHRLLFTRFLTENHLLITDEENGSVPVTLEECEELAQELGARDGFDLASRFAGRILPGVFRRDDPVLELPLALNDQVEMRRLLAQLPSECFQADDALGWTYQFWQTRRKKEVNDSGKKIGAGELAPVTQLFTEDYMVEFLLHNTLGAWWAGKLGPIAAENEAEARLHAALPTRDGIPAIAWTYLRFLQDETTRCWRPAAGSFDGWPREARHIRLLDPCMGSGHFLVFALPLLVRLRMEEEGLGAREAVTAVLRDNLHGLELDERCTQIAAFNVALTAWKLSGYQPLPGLHLACSGIAPSADLSEWLKIAGEDERLRGGLTRLHALFQNAPVLGSLIDPRRQQGNLYEADYHELTDLLQTLLKADTSDPSHETAIAAQGIAKAAELLAGRFTLVATNVPYLGRGKQAKIIREHCEKKYAESKTDIATCFIERCLELCKSGESSTALVTPQNWLSLPSYSKLRIKIIRNFHINLFVRLGANAFETIGGEVVNVALISISRKEVEPHIRSLGCEVETAITANLKRDSLIKCKLLDILQINFLNTPDVRITTDNQSNLKLLSNYAISPQGIKTGDDSHFRRNFWEIEKSNNLWSYYQGSPEFTSFADGMHYVLDWSRKGSNFSRLQGMAAWKNTGVIAKLMGDITGSLYYGELFDSNVTAIVPKNMNHLAALWCYATSQHFKFDLKRLENGIKVNNATAVKVPFDLDYWQKVAAEKYPDGLPKPHSDDPTQWLFNGHPKGSEQPLHVAVARLLGYRWPRQTGSSFPDCPALGPDGLEALADEDGLVCLPPLNREQPAAARLRQLLTAALGTFDERALLASAGLKGSKSATLEDWLRDEFFEQHTKLFHDRPFIWHLWDGRADGFHVLVNYHRLEHATLQKLTYSHLGNWIRQQDEDARADRPGAAERLGAARALQQRLAAILEGEAPLDIFVRWKPLREQARGWYPDPNDGIRQNIRPFLLAGDVGKKGAGLFRAVPLKLADKDRGTEPKRSREEYPWFWCEEAPGKDPLGGKDFVGNRWNNVHLTLARKKAGGGETEERK